MAHDWTAIKKSSERNAFAEQVDAILSIAFLLCINRGFGHSEQNSDHHATKSLRSYDDCSGAITDDLSELVNASQIGIMGSSYSGVHVLCVHAFG